MKVLKENTGPPFKTTPETLRLEYGGYIEDCRSIFRGRLTLHATALAFFMSTLAGYGVLISTGAQSSEKLTSQARMLLEKVVVILPLTAVLVHIAFIIIHFMLQYAIIERSLRRDVLQSMLCKDLIPGDFIPDPTDWNQYNERVRAEIRYHVRMPHELFAGILHIYAVLVWLYLAYQAL